MKQKKDVFKNVRICLYVTSVGFVIFGISMALLYLFGLTFWTYAVLSIGVGITLGPIWVALGYLHLGTGEKSREKGEDK